MGRQQRQYGELARETPFLQLRLKTRRALHSVYLPFIRDGGLFLPSLREHKLGETLLVLLQLQEQNETQAVAGRVVWIRPATDARGKAGIGVQLSTLDGGTLRQQIETLLSEFPTPSSYRP